ncbi:HEAT repeat domain-containing protein [Neochlamydia sp. AcF65]|uniref:HEAT repeat domain-containing protein n=1 Tax=Neochlamydia sp. AcF65 TaxID=2795735 RepID=UPI001BC9CF86|nr:HEAT repeat domain-containing protein [Neochlamydia sp. AcF65]
MREIIFWIGCSLAFLCSAAGYGNEETYVQAAHAHLRIQDFGSASQEAKEGLYLFPHSKTLWAVYIKALAKQGDEKEMLATWKNYIEIFPEEKDNRALIETLAWGVIEHATFSSLPTIRFMAILSAFFSQDAKGIKILLKGLKDKNSALRSASAQMSAHYRDQEIKEEMLRLFHEETVWNVRLQVIRSLGLMKVKEAKQELLDLLQKTTTTAEETRVVIESLVNLWGVATREDVSRLAKDKRAALRLLACEVIAHGDMKDAIDLIIPLIHDSHAEVRQAALWVIGYLRIQEVKGESLWLLVEKKLEDIDPLVSIKAAWLLTLNGSLKGPEAFIKWLESPKRDVRIIAAANLAACGKYAFPLIEEQFNKSADPYVSINLALGLISQRVEIRKACQVLCQGLTHLKEKWSWDEKNHVRALVPNRLRHFDDPDVSPAIIDQMTRLEILNVLAIMRDSQAQQAIKSFLKEKTWGITALASVTLLSEGDQTAIDLVQELLNDEEVQVRVQAALIMARWGRSEKALETLLQAFPEADREMKERILEGMMHISSSQSIPFLLHCLQDSYPSLRVIAAAGLIMCLYH